MIPGHATAEGTSCFAHSHLEENFNRVMDLTLSNVGMGTYLGDSDDSTDDAVKDAIKRSAKAGVNVFDTAINYRGQRAERSVGRAISDLIEDGFTRDQFFISTKNGYVTNDSEMPGDFWTYVRDEYVKKGVVGAGDITSGYHCMTIPYLEDQLERSLRNLGLECVDLLYIHNVIEGQGGASREDILEKIGAAFDLYEKKRRERTIRYYGMATWECFRVPDGDPQFLALEEMVKIARDAGGRDHGLRFIQVPFNMYYDQALMLKNQLVGSVRMSLLESAKNLGVGVFTSVPLMQGRLLQPGIMSEFLDLPPALRALQFVRSTPGVLAPLVGQKTQEHLEENLRIMELKPIPESDFPDLVKRIVAA